jgi:hypothetical protein
MWKKCRCTAGTSIWVLLRWNGNCLWRLKKKIIHEFVWQAFGAEAVSVSFINSITNLTSLQHSFGKLLNCTLSLSVKLTHLFIYYLSNSGIFVAKHGKWLPLERVWRPWLARTYKQWDSSWGACWTCPCNVVALRGRDVTVHGTKHKSPPHRPGELRDVQRGGSTLPHHLGILTHNDTF